MILCVCNMETTQNLNRATLWPSNSPPVYIQEKLVHNRSIHNRRMINKSRFTYSMKYRATIKGMHNWYNNMGESHKRYVEQEKPVTTK